MKRFTTYYFPLIIILLLITSCSFVKPIEFKNINSFKVGENTETKSITITTNLTLYNPNGFKFAINNAYIDVYAEGVNLGKLQIPNQIVVNAKDEFLGDFKVEISLIKLLLAGKNVLSKFKSGKIKVTLKGTIDADFLWIHKNFSVDYVENIDLR